MLLRELFIITAVAGTVCAAPSSFFEKRQEQEPVEYPDGIPDSVPHFVVKHAPLIYLHPEEEYFPTDIEVFLTNTKPQVNFQDVAGPNPLVMKNVHQLPENVFLTSKDFDVTHPDTKWIRGVRPDNTTGKTNNAVPTSVFVVDRGNDIIHAFYMFFYAFNYGVEVASTERLNFGNHVGDFEYLMIRFVKEQPEEVWFSQHGYGQAFKWIAVKKEGDRPVAYSSKGSHANYAEHGEHDISPLGLTGTVTPVKDIALPFGAKWDPILSAYWYKYKPETQKFRTYDGGKTSKNWLKFKGRWGDEEYTDSDKRQKTVSIGPGDFIAGGLFANFFPEEGKIKAKKFNSGPTGPFDKQLDRPNVCPPREDQACELLCTLQGEKCD
ncbi:hypothetical protein M011DRAFT_482515 [Sporormia fimetaria CBS 119925]|uniref:Vacuolar protein sorting-associated protein 62 n=1 Tax=Sporormia fimetaria CBS 119925 TaxID=1340428 RepID=A0A6A6VMB9_9PLEO|nr:hypothetical protein M011DRAFT_482515 [Sporormia fimetaria CBS 119925]